jgi:hypothetical protein
VKNISLDEYPAAVKRFFLALPADPRGCVVELNGQAVACVVPIPSSMAAADGKWTDAKNDRRCDLIDKEYAGGLTVEEQIELQLLQREMWRHLNRVAPLPIEHARRLYRRLLRKAGKPSKRSSNRGRK